MYYMNACPDFKLVEYEHPLSMNLKEGIWLVGQMNPVEMLDTLSAEQ